MANPSHVPSHVEGTLRAFVDACAARTPTPGGGAASALFAAVGAALGAMAARFTAGKKGFEQHAAAMEEGARAFDRLRERFLPLVDEDCRAYDGVSAALALPKSTDAEKAARSAAMQTALRAAMETPLSGAELCGEGLERIAALAPNMNTNLISDAGVCALALHAAFAGFAMNVRINAAGLKDETARAAALRRLEELRARAEESRRSALGTVEGAL